ncbi:hypothetical protein O7630_33130 [Micromonospora sp. WMMD718]|uniref:hypothetical protein n=1 Tax=Micromonospora sp. WMMD718 TaxID=3016098 RepID=UPI002416FE0F|nr:hypothetical protein [Micromonospora sp. WMMD718]MDG4755792.1 hypothetical protein [Micromonospora sp. WMMD718]
MATDKQCAPLQDQLYLALHSRPYPDTGAPDGDDTGEGLAEVIPLGVFDPYLEATKRW